MELYKKVSDRILSKIVKFSKSTSGKYGFPFVLFVVVGSFALREFTEIRFKYRNTGEQVYEKAIEAGIEMKKPGEVTLETVYAAVKDLDIEHWENKRGPRPWEENTSQ